MASGKEITFLDTPGHAAFSAMRARGALVTDIVVLVVAADDGVMPQTIEAIKHTQDAGVQMVVAINKCDKPNTRIYDVKLELLKHSVILEEHGGEIPVVPVSGLTVRFVFWERLKSSKGVGLIELEEAILAMAEVSDLRGDVSGPVEGFIIESRVVKGQGFVSSMIVKRGTLKPGQLIVAGKSWCKVRSISDSNGKRLTEAFPSTPVEISGWKDLPTAGDLALEAPDEETAKAVVESRKNKEEYDSITNSIDDLNKQRMKTSESEDETQKPTVHLIFKDKKVAAAAKAANVSIQRFDIVYELLDAVKEYMSELLPPDEIVETVGEAEVLQVFQINTKGKTFEPIAGCRVTLGKIHRNEKIKIERQGEIVYDGTLKTFKHHKKDVQEIAKGLECGMGFEKFTDFQAGDKIVCYRIRLQQRKIQ
ncbi:hypothetical protein HDU96_009391 [Phlyctochytrium bullatum]|nr:hypothetical protein HDU96_009391 [Phlyctochytrium bullatum]